jgi:RNA-binding protein
MSDTSLTGAQKSKLRGLGQQLDATLKLGKEGITPAFFGELTRALRAHELVKLRFVGDADRHARAALCERIATEGHCICVGSVGHTALFYRKHAEPSAKSVALK